MDDQFNEFSEFHTEAIGILSSAIELKFNESKRGVNFSGGFLFPHG